MSEHPTWQALLAHCREPDFHVAEHLSACETCRAQLAILHAERDALLDPPLPPLAQADADRMIAAALDAMPSRAPVAAPAHRWSARIAAQWAAIFLIGATTGAYAMTLAFPELREVVTQALFRGTQPPEVSPSPPPIEAPPTTPRRPRATPRTTITPDAPPEPPDLDEPAPPPTATPASREVDTLFREASDALAAGEVDIARALLEILVALHPGTDVEALLLAERGLRLRLTDPAAAAAAFRQALARDPRGGLADDLRQWLCEIDPTACP